VDKERILKNYIQELLVWNKKINLIGRSTEANLWEVHIENSLELLPFLNDEDCESIVDIGSGAGFPSIPLSIYLPGKRFFLTEVNQKKIAFLTYVKKILDLKNVEVININEGFYFSEECIVTSRAFSSLFEIKKWSERHLKMVRKFFVFKGEIEKIKNEIEQAKIKEYELKKIKMGYLVIFQ